MQNFVAFALFLKNLIQVFCYLGYTADLEISILLNKAKDEIRHNIRFR